VIARKMGVRVVPVDRKGYGSALRGGILAARGRYVITGDADDWKWSHAGHSRTQTRAQAFQTGPNCSLACQLLVRP
jgi:hypothetical protein